MKLRNLKIEKEGKVCLLYAILSSLKLHRNRQVQWKANHISNLAASAYITLIPLKYASESEPVRRKLLTA